jgi:hypothetical protein
MENETDLVELNEHLNRLKGFLDKYKNLPDDAKESLKKEIEHIKNTIHKGGNT